MSQGQSSPSVPNSDLGTGETTAQIQSPSRQRIGFVGPEAAGKTTVAAMVASRLVERTTVMVTGEAAAYVDRPESSPATAGPLGLDWAVVDHSPGLDALETTGETLDTVFVVSTPETLDQVAPYERVADRLGLDAFLVVNRFEECHRDLLGEFDGPDLAEYFYEDTAVEAAMSAGTVPRLEEWTTEAVVLESLQSERMARSDAMTALDRGKRAIVNVEVESDASAIDVIRSFRENGYPADFFRCNCRCHEGHVVARTSDSTP